MRVGRLRRTQAPENAKNITVYDVKGEPKKGVKLTIAYPSSADLIKGVTDEKGSFSIGVRGWMFSDLVAIADGVHVTVRKGILPKPPLKLTLPSIDYEEGRGLEEIRVIGTGNRYDDVYVSFKATEETDWQRIAAGPNGVFRLSAPLADWSSVEVVCERGGDSASVRILRPSPNRDVKAIVVTLPIYRWEQ